MINKSWILVAMLASLAVAQEGVIVWSDLIGSAQTDPALVNAQQKATLLEESRTTRLWDELEFKYEADGVDFREHKLDLKVSIAPFGEIGAEKKYWDIQSEYQKVRREAKLGDLRHDRYRLGLQWLNTLTQIQYHQELIKVYEDRIQVHLARSGSENFDAMDLVEAKEKLVDLKGELLRDSASLAERTRTIRLWTNSQGVVMLDSTWLPSLDLIKKRIDLHPILVDSLFPDMILAGLRLKVAEKRFELENASKRDWLSYVQAGYNHRIPEAGSVDKRETAEKFSIGAGFKIPIFDGRNQDIVKRQLNLLEEQSDYVEQRKNLEQRVTEIRAEIISLVNQREMLKEYVSEVDAGNLFADFAAKAGSEPLLLLKARESGLQTIYRADKLKYEIYIKYLDLLELSGELSRQENWVQIFASL